MWQRYVRGWHLLAGLIAIAVIGVALALYLREQRSLDTPALVSYLPQRDAAVFYADFRSMRASGVLGKIVGSTVGEEAEYKTFVSQTGFDYKRDLHRAAGSSADGITYLLVEGRFDWDKIRRYVKDQQGTCQDDYCSITGTTPGRVLSFHPLRKDLMAFASAKDASAAREIQKRTTRQFSFDIPAEPVWAFLPSSTIRAQQQQAPSGTRLFAKALEAADHALLVLGSKGSDFEVAMDISCRREEDAVVLKHQLEGLTKLLQSLISRENKTPSQTDLSGVLTSGVFERLGTHVKARWPLPRSFVDSLGSS